MEPFCRLQLNGSRAFWNEFSLSLVLTSDLIRSVRTEVFKEFPPLSCLFQILVFLDRHLSVSDSNPYSFARQIIKIAKMRNGIRFQGEFQKKEFRMVDKKS